ncbi:MAG: hypothetical protein P1U85_17455 [Verrucomicrobiales bacterium]|nr:hypothetical protein [Verrucomicrobiales bacterium]
MTLPRTAVALLTRSPLLGLVGLSFLLAFLWRLEIELRGWQSLGWITYFHLAVPVGGAIFLGWVALLSERAPLPRRLILWVATWGGISIFTLEVLLKTWFDPWRMMLFTGSLPEPSWEGLAVLILGLFWFFWAAHLLILYIGYRKNFAFPKRIWLIGGGLWTFSWVLGLLLITLLPERGSHDFVHALKTGWMIPFCVFAVGLPIAVSANHRAS